jgi:hypothetical protein
MVKYSLTIEETVYGAKTLMRDSQNTPTGHAEALLAGNLQAFDYVLALAKKVVFSKFRQRNLSTDIIDELTQQALLDVLTLVQGKRWVNDYELYQMVSKSVEKAVRRYRKDSKHIVYYSDIDSTLDLDGNESGYQRLFTNNEEEARLIENLDTERIVESYKLDHPGSITAKILELLAFDPSLKSNEIAQRLQLNQSVIRNALSRLRRTLRELRLEPATKLLYREERTPDVILKCTADVIAIDNEMIRYFQRHPSELYTLNPRRFEELIAAILKDLGYAVELTALGADGGVDIFATQKTGIGEVLVIVDCKRYAPENHVGVGIVRSLYGISEQMRATMAMLATTSFFTRAAKEFQRMVKNRLSLKDYNDLISWLESYGQFSSNRIV